MFTVTLRSWENVEEVQPAPTSRPFIVCRKVTLLKVNMHIYNYMWEREYVLEQIALGLFKMKAV